jgi:phosphohistidine phosphatase
MNLILVRHATAEDREDFLQKNKEDSLRPLTPKGRKRMEMMTDQICKWVPSVDLIVTSPYTRAVQTSEILRKKYPKVRMSVASELVPHSPPQAFIRWLKMQPAAVKTIVAVGHEPQLSTFMTYLLSSKNQSFIEFKKSGAAALEILSWEEIESSQAQLLWLVQPKMFTE